MKEKQEEKHPVVFMSKGGFHLNSTYISINMYFEMMLTWEEQYYGNQSELEDAIIAKVLEDKSFLTDLFPIDERYFDDIYVDGDDCYERHLDDSFITPNPNWNYRKFLWGDYKYITIDDVTYKVAVKVSREWFPGEEQQN